MELQDTFYWIAIIYMIFMFLVTVVLLIVLGVVASKIKRAQRNLQRKADALRAFADSLGNFLHAVRRIARG